MKKLLFSFTLCSGLLVQPVWASPSTGYIFDLKHANQLAQQVMQTCIKKSQPAAVVILDQAGQVLASQRHESVGPHNLIAAQRKAFTAYSTKTSTLDFMRSAQKNPDAANLNTLPELLLLGGGIPLFYQNQLLGAVGVAGAGGSVQDHACAQHAVGQMLKTMENSQR